MTGERRETLGFWVASVGAALLLLGMSLPLWLGRVYIHNDLGFQFVPWRGFLAACLASGDGTAWCPGLFGGYYFLGEGGGVAHPLLRTLYATLPLGPALDVEVMVPYASMLVGLPLLLMRWGLRKDAAVLGGVLYAFGGPNFVHYIHPTLMVSYAHLPWLMLAADVALRTQSPTRAAWARTGVALLSASQLLSAHVQAVWISGLAEVAYAGFVAWHVPEARRRLAGLATFKGLGCLGGAAQLLPQWEAFRDSIRAKPTPTYVAMGSVPPWNLLQWFAPYLTATGVVIPPMATDNGVLAAGRDRLHDWRVHEFTFYLGAIVPVLLLWLVTAGWKRLAPQERALMGFALAGSLLALLLAFGDFTPLFAITRRLPVVGSFRVPGRYLTLFQLGVSVLVALSYASLSRRRSDPAQKTWAEVAPLLVLPAIAVVVCLMSRMFGGAWPFYLRGEYLASRRWMVLGPVLMAASVLLVTLAARGWRPALLAIPLSLAVDLGAYDTRAALIHPPQPLDEFLSTWSAPREVVGSRVAFDKAHVVTQGVYTLEGLRPIEGYVSLPPRRALTYKRATSQRVASIDFVFHEEHGQPVWRPLEGTLPRARLVTRTKTSRDPERDLDAIDPGTTVLTSREISLPADSRAGTARIVTDRPGKMDVVTDAPTAQFLVVSESYHHGWRVEIDGRPTRRERAYGDFLGAVVPAGQHRVALRFRPTSQVVGYWISVAAVAVAIAPPLLSVARRRSVGPARVRHSGAIPAPHMGRVAERV